MFVVVYEVEYIAKTFLLQLTTTCLGLIGHHQVVNTSCKESEDKKGSYLTTQWVLVLMT
jgi:hypothetical protein